MNLVIQLARFGDLIQSKRLILTLEQEGPVHIALDESLAALAAKVYPKAILHPVSAQAGSGRDSSSVLRQNAATFAQLATLDFKRIYNLNNSPMNLALSAMFAPDKIVGHAMANGRQASSNWVREAGRWSRERKSSPINLVDFWAHFHPSPVAPGAVNPIARPKNIPGTGEGQRIGVVLSGRESRRSLPPDYLARVMEAVFIGRKGPKFILLGSSTEQEYARKLCRELRPATLSRVEDTSGKTTLADMPELVSSLDLLLTPDTGTMHLAAHLGVPVMAFFLSSAWAFETGPYGMGHTVWQATMQCLPCLESAPCPHGTACLEVFKSPDWLAHLAGKHSGAWPDKLLGLVSTFDALGLNFLCVDGDDDITMPQKRQARRALLTEQLGLFGADMELNLPTEIAEELFHERDWLLPDPFGTGLIKPANRP